MTTAKIDSGILLCRRYADLASAHASTATDEASRAEHQYVGRVLHTISATTGSVSAEMCRRWAAEEESVAELPGSQRYGEGVKAAYVLRYVADEIERRNEQHRLARS